VLTGAIKESCGISIHAIYGFCGCEVVELNAQPDHVHLIVMVPPKIAISALMGRLKGQRATVLNNIRFNFDGRPALADAMAG
jgi:putative transposase